MNNYNIENNLTLDDEVIKKAKEFHKKAKEVEQKKLYNDINNVLRKMNNNVCNIENK